MTVAISIDHDVIPKELKGCRKGRNRNRATQKWFYYDLVHLRPNFVEGIVHLCESIFQSFHWYFTSPWKIGWLLSFLIIFVHREVCQVNKCIFHGHWFQTKFFSTKPSKTFPIDKSLKGMKRSHKNIDSHIKFITI